MTTTTFPVTEPIKVVARIGHGTFEVNAVDGLTQASVTLTAPEESSEMLSRTTVELRGSTLQIISPRQGGIFDVFNGRHRDAIDVRITVPSGTPIKVGSFTAELTVRGRSGSCDLAAATSVVRAEFIDGDLRLRAGSGSCDVERVSGSVHARTGSGEVSIGAIHGNVDVATGNGELRIGLPEGVTARLDLTTGFGEVDSQLPISSVGPGSGRAIKIRARTGRGDVHLFRAA